VRIPSDLKAKTESATLILALTLYRPTVRTVVIIHTGLIYRHHIGQDYRIGTTQIMSVDIDATPDLDPVGLITTLDHRCDRHSEKPCKESRPASDLV